MTTIIQMRQWWNSAENCDSQLVSWFHLNSVTVSITAVSFLQINLKNTKLHIEQQNKLLKGE